MSEATINASAAVSAGAGIRRDFELLQYWLRTSKVDFDLAKFNGSLSPDDSNADDFVTVAPRDGERGHYSIVCSWNERGEDVEFTIDFVNEAWRHTTDEQPPYAEDFIRWLGQFFRHPSVRTHLHARFRFPIDARDTTFPLILTTGLPNGAQLNGVSIKLADDPEGVLTVQMLRGQSEWYADVASERNMTFSEFSPYVDIDASVAVLRDFLAERSS
ncbi:MAG TPA: hypothetical protein VNA69_02530 [Thermoanaerobaculia bacterium]|nr:hypothetical protein [Thermoanaerobaculia bacterium]